MILNFIFRYLIINIYLFKIIFISSFETSTSEYMISPRKIERFFIIIFSIS